MKGAMLDWIGEGNTPYFMPDGVTYYTREKPTFVTIMGGINDSRIDATGIIQDVSLQNFRSMIRYCKRYEIIPIVCTPTPIDKTVNTTACDATSWAYLQELTNKIKVVCSQEKVIIANTYESLNNATANIDQVSLTHPSNAGHDLVYQEIYNTINQN